MSETNKKEESASKVDSDFNVKRDPSLFIDGELLATGNLSSLVLPGSSYLISSKKFIPKAINKSKVISSDQKASFNTESERPITSDSLMRHLLILVIRLKSKLNGSHIEIKRITGAPDEQTLIMNLVEPDSVETFLAEINFSDSDQLYPIVFDDSDHREEYYDWEEFVAEFEKWLNKFVSSQASDRPLEERA